ncbi:MAG: ABC transporter permease [Alphaproteobacteria bacterium]
MTSDRVRRLMVGFYILLFFGFLFGPLLLMGAAAFNDVSYPQVLPWQGFTVQWFAKLVNDNQMMQGITNSLWIGLGVVALSVPIGLAGALVMSQIGRRGATIYYTIVISPVLTPGVVLGISTLVFWDRLGTSVGAGYDTLFYDGFFLTVVGQSSFISAYCMLVFLARLQRFDRGLEEAALDLGASQVQVFWKILIPYLRPAILAAAVLAFLSSFENYNTTLFTILSENTLTIVLAGKVRMGTQPDLSALAVVIMAITLIGASAHEILKRREAAREKAALAEARGEAGRLAPARLATVPAG